MDAGRRRTKENDLRWTFTASSRSQSFPNSNLWIKVIPAGPPSQAPDQSSPPAPLQALDPLSLSLSLGLFLSFCLSFTYPPQALARACPPAPDGGRWNESCQKRRRHWRGWTAAQLRPVSRTQTATSGSN